MLRKHLIVSLGIAALGLTSTAIFAQSSCTLASNPFGAVPQKACSENVGLSMGGGFDIFNGTDAPIELYVHDAPLPITIQNNHYGPIDAKWWEVKLLCHDDTVCPAKIVWKGQTVNTTINTQNGYIDTDTSLDPALSGLNAKLSRINPPLKAGLSNATQDPGRQGYELITVTPK